jgi:hypothetical protein
VTRGTPSDWSRLALPRRQVRSAATVTCPECHDVVPTRDGRIAGHYAVATTLCSASSKPISNDPKERP